jgi:hypothetical protein
VRERRKPGEIDRIVDGEVFRRCKGCGFEGEKRKHFPETKNWRSQYYCLVCRNPIAVRQIKAVVAAVEEEAGRPLQKILLIGTTKWK